MNIKCKDTPESRAHWDHAERVMREVEAEILAERARRLTIDYGATMHDLFGDWNVPLRGVHTDHE